MRTMAFVVAGLAALTLAGMGTAQPLRAEPPLPAGVDLVRDVQFGTGGGRPLRLHLLRPRTMPPAPMPVLVWIHGGAWQSGSKDGGIPMLGRFAQRGYLGASVEYRLSQEAIFPAQIEDCKCAIRFLRAKAKEYHLDPDRIGAWGSSAGGHLVALLGTSGDAKDLEGKGGWQEFSSRVQAVCDWFGPTDFLKMDAAGSQLKHDGPDSPESRLIGGPIQANPEKAARANPITYVTRDDPPFLIMHGDQDPLVPLNQSELLFAALKKAGVDAALHVVKGAGHGFGGREIDAMVDAFFDARLKKLTPSPRR
jgi:acetyl esterase/lipase